jgi:NAD+ dependent glucose-6-phosphate dehydrogenase
MALVVTGASGNLGGKLVASLGREFALRCLDRQGGDGCIAADLSIYDEHWVQQFEGADTVLHFAGEPRPTAPWAKVQRGNIVATWNVLRAARRCKVRRVVFASTNQVMAGYRFRNTAITTEMPPAPLNPYAVSKLFCEEAGRAFASQTGISFIALRIGNIQPGDNVPHAGMGLGLWGQQMWLSNRDFIAAVRAAILAREVPFAIVNLVSNNPGTPWDLTHTRAVLGFVPQDRFAPDLSPEDRTEEELASRARLVPGEWLDQTFRPMRG